jgi:hypothetical protein
LLISAGSKPGSSLLARPQVGAVEPAVQHERLVLGGWTGCRPQLRSCNVISTGWSEIAAKGFNGCLEEHAEVGYYGRSTSVISTICVCRHHHFNPKSAARAIPIVARCRIIWIYSGVGASLYQLLPPAANQTWQR